MSAEMSAMRALRNSLLLLVLLLVGMVASGCGGGTTGSGDLINIKVTGAVVDTQGKGVVGASINDLISGTSASSGDGGAFELSAAAQSGVVSLDISANGTSGTIEVRDIPVAAKSVAIEVVIDAVSGIATLASVEIDPVSTAPEPEGVSQRIEGTVFGLTGRPVKNLEVSAGTQRARTNSQGRFVLQTKTTNGRIELILRYKQHVGLVKISGIPRTRSCSLRVRIEVSVTADQIPLPDPTGSKLNKLKTRIESVSVS